MIEDSLDRYRHWLLAAIVLVYSALAGGYNLANPLFESPDEVLHFDFVRYLQRNGVLPVVALDASLSEYHQPPLYYGLAALVTLGVAPDGYRDQIQRNPFWGYDIGGVSRDNKNQFLHPPEGDPRGSGTVIAVHLIRLLSTLMGAAGVIGTYRLMRELVPARSDLALAASSMTAFIPNYLLTTASVTNDALVAATSVWLLVWTLRCLRRSAPPTSIETAALGGALGLSALAKVSSYPVAVMGALMLVIWAWRIRSFEYALKSTAILSVGFLASSGWWFARNFMVYGDLTGLEQMWRTWGERAPLTLAQLPIELYNLRTTFWANFGYGNVPAPEPLYTALDVAGCIAVLGLILRMWAQRRPLHLFGEDAPWFLVAGWLSLTAVALFWYLTRTQQVTGRQVYAALPAIAAFAVLGWSAWEDGRWRVARLAAIGLGFAGLGTWGLFGLLIPSYSPAPVVTETEADARITRSLNWTFSDVARLRGITLDRTEVRDGERLTATLFWEPLRQTDSNLSMFVQLVGSQERKFGQRDTFPGLGNNPTTLWHIGGVLVDQIVVPIEGGDSPGTRVQLLIGLQDLATGQPVTVTDSSGRALDTPIAAEMVYRTAIAGPEPEHELSIAFEQGLQLAGYNLGVARPGTDITLTLLWAPTGRLDSAYSVFIHLRDSAGDFLPFEGPPRGGWYPSTDWVAGEVVPDAHVLSLPAELKPGTYELAIGLYRALDGARLRLADGGDTVIIPLQVRGP